MDFDFSVPIKLSDLKTKTGERDFAVTEVYQSRQLPSKLAELKTELRNSCTKSTIPQHFGTLFSVLSNASRDLTVREAAWTLVVKCFEALYELLKAHLEGGALKDQALKNSLMMLLYMTCEFVEVMENEANRPTTEQIVAGKKKRGKSRAVSVSASTIDWPYERERVIKLMTQVMTLPVQRLWEPPVADQAIVNCLGNCCFKLLNNAETMRLKDIKQDVFRLLGTLIKRHKYSISAALQTMERLKHFEHMASTMAQAMEVVTKEFGVKTTTKEILREISQLSVDYLVKDSAATRSYSTFLIELTDLTPDLVLPQMLTLLPFLDGEAPTMRSTILSVLGKLIASLLTGDQLDTNHKNMREEFLDTLCEHVHDMNGHVRAKALQVITGLVEAKAVPVSWYQRVTTLARDRLQDKLANVRKYSIQLLISLITHNPYGAKLTDVNLSEMLTNERQKLKSLQPDKSSAPTTVVTISTEENWQAMRPDVENAVIGYLDTSKRSMDDSDSLDDSETVDSIVEQIGSLLKASRHNEAIRLLMQAQAAFGGSCLELSPLEDDSDESVSRIVNKLSEIFRTQKAEEIELAGETGPVDSKVQEEISKQEVIVKYLEETQKFSRQVQDTMPFICKLLTSKTSSDCIESIQFVIATVQFGVTEAMNGLATMLKLIWVDDSSIKSMVVHAFRNLYLYSEDTGSRDADGVVASLIALTRVFQEAFGLITSWEAMVAEFVRSDDITSRVWKILWQIFTMKFPGSTEEDSKIALKLLAMTARARPAIVSSNMDTLVSEGLGDRAMKDFYMCRDACFALLTLAASDQKPGEAYKKPLRLSADHQMVTSLVQILTIGVSDLSQCGWIPMAEQAIMLIYALSESPDNTCASIIRSIYSSVFTQELSFALITRFISLLGQVALCQIRYLEGDVLASLKNKRKKPSTTTPARGNSTSETTGGELGQTTSDDLETEVVMKVIETELLEDGNLLPVFVPMMTHILTNQNKFDDPDLQTASTLALGKYMLISPTFCQQHLRLYFTVLEKSSYTGTKTNAIIALSDMVFRYPNELEPWTPNLYARLRDESTAVRKSTLMVLTRLILNDMVKVKGQISEIAVCLVDDESAMRNLAGQFFSELSTKGSSLYNVLLDIVSRLSDSEVGVPEEKFQTICEELFSHVKNEKQCESLMERFLLRFTATAEERQWRDLSYCLSKLSYTERSIKKLSEHFSCFADKLADEQIYNNFTQIISSCTQKLQLKPGAGVKELLNELSSRIEIAHNKGVCDTEAVEQATQSQCPVAPPSATKHKRQSTRKGRRSRVKRSNSDSENDSDESRTSVSSNRSVNSKRPVRSTRQAMKPLQNLIEASDEEEEVFTKSAPRTKRAQHKAKLALSSSEEEDDVGPSVLTPDNTRRRSGRLHKLITT